MIVSVAAQDRAQEDKSSHGHADIPRLHTHHIPKTQNYKARSHKLIVLGGNKEGVLEALVQEGMNVARLNFSHGSHEEHEKRIRTVRELSKKANLPVAVLLDTKGPEIRTGELKEDKVFLKNGERFTLYAEERIGDETGVSITFPDLCRDVSVGSRILLDDGLISLQVEEVTGEDIICKSKRQMLGK